MVIKIGHRGAMGYSPENTLSSFKKALQLKVDMIEFDVQLCKSGEIVIIHDDNVDRTTSGSGYISEKTLSELKSLDAGNGEKIPTLNEALDLINRKVKVNIELKAQGIAKPVFELIEHYVKNKGWKYSDFLISSFNHSELEEFYKLNKKIQLGVLWEEIPPRFTDFAKKINAWSVNLSLDFINQGFVDKAHKKGFKVLVYTVNDLADIKRMISLSVDGIFSNYPDRI